MLNTWNFVTLHFGRRLQIAVAGLGIVFALGVVATQSARAQTYTIMHSFSDGQDGGGPMAGLARDAAGNFYGTTPFGGYFGGECGGEGGCGTVFKVTKRNGAWIFAPLYAFTGGDDGWSSVSAVTIGPDGNVYGTTLFGGGHGCTGGYGCGLVFKLTPPVTACRFAVCGWMETVIYRFGDGPNGIGNSWSHVTFDAAGNLYGTLSAGGTGACYGGCGVVYKLAPSGGSWTLSIIYNFTGGTDGALPTGGLTFDRAGNLYGTTQYGGSAGYGNVFELIRSGEAWTATDLHDFKDGNDGSFPLTGVVLDSSGNVYGDTSQGGPQYGGVVYQLMPSGGSWIYSILANFRGGLEADLGMDSAGNLYGTTYVGGSHDDGLVFKLSQSQGSWTETDMHSFSGTEGAFPYSSVIFDPSGNLYGTATIGGVHGYGVVWEITP